MISAKLRERLSCLALALASLICSDALGAAGCPGTSPARSKTVAGADAYWQELSAQTQARIEEFFVLVNAHQFEDALASLGGDLVATEADRQAWQRQFTAIRSICIQSILPAAVEDWTETRQIFKLAIEAQVSEDTASQPIPYFGWDSSTNIRWVTTELSAQGQWQITAISTGP